MFEHILVPLDGSPLAECVLPHTVALARAFLKDAPLLLLDEPAAGLDAENEGLIINALETLSRGHTVLMLTHRLTHLKKMSRIMVLEKGRIIEQGTYVELTAAGGAFHRMAFGNK